ncbi:O-Glycosyl hydrolase family 30 [Oesophagostomum dentatum]|uniref:Glucosylceramidase n=1 Tax=Oesophagostomum dentatum TaxID=61180 RepID=A0A0B1TEB6_OESDE|nr:O-Glycosyl hydrolase family 30 [Oesophagostomum dentatum]
MDVANFDQDNPDRPCIRKTYKSADTNIVCVCNATYCDDIEPLASIPNGKAVVYVSSLAGKRFERSTVPILESRGEANLEITVDARQEFQSIIGFGGAITDSAGINLASLSEKTQKRILETYFGKNGWFFTVKDLVQIPYILSALNLTGGNLKLFASPWSAPGWMKTNGRMKGGGALLGKMNGEYYKSYATYLTRFFEEYAKNGVKFWGMTLQNEPTSGALPFYGWQTMFMSATMERDFVKGTLGPMFKKNDATKDLKVIALDDNRMWLPNWADKVGLVFMVREILLLAKIRTLLYCVPMLTTTGFPPTYPWVNFILLPSRKGYGNTVIQSTKVPIDFQIFDDPEATKYVDGIGVHWYLNALASPSVLTTTHEHHPEKFILATEACTGSIGIHGPILGDWYRGEEYAEDIIMVGF